MVHTFETRHECLGELHEFIRRNATTMSAHIVKDDTNRFIEQHCMWINVECPDYLEHILSACGIPTGPVYTVASFLYKSVERKVMDILIEIGCDDTVAIETVLKKFDNIITADPCYVQSKTRRIDIRDRLLSLCVYANEKINIPLCLNDVRGTIITIGQLLLRPRVECDHCSWMTMTGPESTHVHGEAADIYNICTNTIVFMNNMIDEYIHNDHQVGHIINSIETGEPVHSLYDEGDADTEKNLFVFDMLMRTAINAELAHSHPRDRMLNQIYWARTNFDSLNAVNRKICDIDDQHRKEINEHIEYLRLFTRHTIMEAIYKSDIYPTYHILKCSMCNKKAYRACPCKSVRYCTSECQRAHWKRHGKTCTMTNYNNKH